MCREPESRLVMNGLCRLALCLAVFPPLWASPAWAAGSEGQESRSSAEHATSSLRLVNRAVSSEAPGLYNAFYLQRTGTVMRSGDKVSTDNGRNWTPAALQPDFAASLPYGYRREPVTSVLDPFTGRLITMVNALDTPGLDPKAHEPPIAQRTYYLRYRVSVDSGKNWLFDEPVVEEGKFSAQHPFDGIWIGTNSIYLGDLGCVPVVTGRGRILAPAQTTATGVRPSSIRSADTSRGLPSRDGWAPPMPPVANTRMPA